MAHGFRIGSVHHLNQEIRQNGFLQRGLERFHQTVRKVADEAHGIRQQQRLPMGKLYLPRCGVQRGKKHIPGHDFRPGHQGQEGGFSGIGITYNGGRGDSLALPFLALRGTLTGHQDQFPLNSLNSGARQTTVHFNLLFPFPPGGSAASLAAAGAPALAVQVVPHAGHARQGILHAGQLHLQGGFPCPGAPGKDVQNDLFTVNDAFVNKPFPFPLLGRGEHIVKNNAIRPAIQRQLLHFLRLSGAAQEFGVHVPGLDEVLPCDADAEIGDKVFQLIQHGLFFPSLGGIEVNGNEHGPFHHFRFFADFKHIGNLTELLAGGRLVILQSEVRGLMTITTA